MINYINTINENLEKRLPKKGKKLVESRSVRRKLNEAYQYKLSWTSKEGDSQAELLDNVDNIANFLLQIEKEGGRNIMLQSSGDSSFTGEKKSKYGVVPDSKGNWGMSALDKYLLLAIKKKYNCSTKEAMDYARKISEQERDQFVKEFRNSLRGKKVTEALRLVTSDVCKIALRESHSNEKRKRLKEDRIGSERANRHHRANLK